MPDVRSENEPGAKVKTESGTAENAKSELGRVWYDFFSWGHISMGLTAFMIAYLTQPAPISFIIVLAVGWVWEVIENNFLVFKGVKFFDKKDSLNNSLADQMFVAIGGLCLWLVDAIVGWSAGDKVWVYVIGVIALVVCMHIMQFTRRIYFKRHAV